MKTVITALMVMVSFCVNMLAQDLPMLRSKDALRTYAIEQASMVSVNIGSYIPVGNANNYGSINISEPTALSISNSIRNISLSIDVVNPKDSLFTWAGVYNSDWDSLFNGNRQFKLVNGSAGYVLPPNYGDLTLELASEIPIKIKGAQYAQLSFQNENGETTYGVNIRTENGKIYFPRQLAGTNAILSVMIDTGGKQNWSYWNVSNGTSIKAQNFAISSKATIKGIVSLTDLEVVMVPVTTANSVGQNMTVELKNTTNRLVAVSFWTTEGKWFKGAWVRKSGTSQWQYYSATTLKGSVGFIFNAQVGVYYIIPDWNGGDLVEPEDPWYPPYYGEGKG